MKEMPMAAPRRWVDYADLGLFTDLYELTMLQAYVEGGMEETATFGLFVRRLPERRNYLLACGLDDVLRYFESLRFTREGLDYLASLGQFTDRFLRWLEGFRFTGDVDAVAEGTPVFENEPILEVSAPIAQAQLAETFVMNQVHLQTVLASKAARVVTAAEGRNVVDFGRSRRRGRFTSPAWLRPPTLLPARSTACPWPAPWRIASFRRRRTRWRRSGPSRRSTPRPSCWSTPTTRCRACAT
jgi:nicotinic acid phosphoribosyltransferase